MKKSFSLSRRLSAICLVAPLLVASAAKAQLPERPGSDRGKKPEPVVTVRAELAVDRGHRTGRLSVAAEIQDGFHIYAMTQPKPFLATQIHVDDSDRFAVTGPFQASRPAKVHRHQSIDVELHEHEGVVTWTAPVKLSAGVDPQTVKITGYVYAQACDASGCRAPTKFPFRAWFNPAGDGETPAASLGVSSSGRPGILEGAVSDQSQRLAAGARRQEIAPSDAPRLDLDKLESETAASGNRSLFVVLLTAFAAGFVLNFMPCVLPVIGLKVLAFVEQAGDRRGRIFALNLWYSAGLMSVFLVLATLAVFLGLGWGEQFSSVSFNVILTSVVFVFALSFLGVWQIPIPGLVGSGRANQLADQEGIGGAFSKGVLSTVLATPCSGPMLGPALTWAVSQPPATAYAGFACVGLGMASPYLLIGAFPRLIAFLPKPGAWMDTFKHIMGFVLLGTVVYLLTFIPIPFVVPTVAFIVGLWVACWWIDQTPLTEALGQKLKAWIGAGAFATVIGVVSFGWLHDVMEARFDRAVDREVAQRPAWANPTALDAAPNVDVTASHTAKQGDDELPWRPYSRTLLKRLIADGNTVFVDFTADWCLTCKTNEAVAVNRPEVHEFIKTNGIVPLKADKTQPAPQVDQLLELLGNKAGSIPFYAVFGARNPNNPVVLDGLFTSPQPLLDALRKAGPSKRMQTQTAGKTRGARSDELVPRNQTGRMAETSRRDA